MAAFKKTHVQLCEGLSGAPRNCKLRAHTAAVFYQCSNKYYLTKAQLVTERHQNKLTDEDLAICLACLQSLSGVDPDKPRQRPLIPKDQIQDRAEAHEAKPRNQEDPAEVLKRVRAQHKLQAEMSLAFSRTKRKEKVDFLWKKLSAYLNQENYEEAERVAYALDGLQEKEEAL